MRNLENASSSFFVYSFDEEQNEEECYDDTFNYGKESDSGYEWTLEDSWDAMTDGMYGEYPGDGIVDWDSMMDDLGY